MNPTQASRYVVASVAGLMCLFISDNWSSQQQSSLVAQADARIGRPLTPLSGAGVARRTTRRAVRGAVYGVGAAGIGTAAYYGTRGDYGGGGAAASADTAPSAGTPVNLTGQYRCISQCSPTVGRYISVAQRDWDFNVASSAGLSSRGWVNSPGRIWVAGLNQAGSYAPDGRFIQIDGGSTWRRMRLRGVNQ
jgi:hypothetical protein